MDTTRGVQSLSSRDRLRRRGHVPSPRAGRRRSTSFPHVLLLPRVARTSTVQDVFPGPDPPLWCRGSAGETKELRHARHSEPGCGRDRKPGGGDGGAGAQLASPPHRATRRSLAGASGGARRRILRGARCGSGSSTSGWRRTRTWRAPTWPIPTGSTCSARTEDARWPGRAVPSDAENALLGVVIVAHLEDVARVLPGTAYRSACCGIRLCERSDRQGKEWRQHIGDLRHPMPADTMQQASTKVKGGLLR
jgi:hypothetical protein